MENLFTIQATVKEVGDLVQIRRTTKPDMYKRVLTLELSDGNLLYPEIRNASLKILEREGIEEGTKVESIIMFQGSEKDGKKYNNVIINQIKKI